MLSTCTKWSASPAGVKTAYTQKSAIVRRPWPASIAGHVDGRRSPNKKQEDKTMWIVHNGKVMIMLQDTMKRMKWVYIPERKWDAMTDQENI